MKLRTVCARVATIHSLLHYFSVILGAVQNFSHALTDSFLVGDAFDYQVNNFLRLFGLLPKGSCGKRYRHLRVQDRRPRVNVSSR